MIIQIHCYSYDIPDLYGYGYMWPSHIYPEQAKVLFFLISIYVSVLSPVPHPSQHYPYIPISISIISLTYIKFMGIFVKHGYF